MHRHKSIPKEQASGANGDEAKAEMRSTKVVRKFVWLGLVVKLYHLCY